MQKTAYEMRISDWSSDVCSSDLTEGMDRGDIGSGHALKSQNSGVERFAVVIAVERCRDRRLPRGHGALGGVLREQAVEEGRARPRHARPDQRSEEHTSELPSLMRISYAVLCLKKKTNNSTSAPT